MVLSMVIKIGMKKDNFATNKKIVNNYGIVYSLEKYRETEGKKDIGSNFWNYGRTQEIKDRVVHLDE